MFRRQVVTLPEPAQAREVSRLEPWGPGLLMLLFFLPVFLRVNPLFTVMEPALRVLIHVFTG